MQARVKNKTGSLVSKEYSLDRLGAKQVMRLPTAKSPAGSSDNLAQGSIPAELQEKVASLLASESSRKVRPASLPSLLQTASLYKYKCISKFWPARTIPDQSCGFQWCVKRFVSLCTDQGPTLACSRINL